MTNDTCINCKLPFTKENVYSNAGWKEVEISGCCELCFDEIMYEENKND